MGNTVESGAETNESRQPSRLFYGWWVVLAASVQGFFGVGIVISGFLVFFLPIQNELGLSSASMSLIIGLAWAISGVVAPAAGWLSDRFGTRRMVLAGGLITGIGIMLLSFSTGYWQLVLFYSVLVSIGRVAGVTPTLMTTVNQWFIDKIPGMRMLVVEVADIREETACLDCQPIAQAHRL